MCERWTSRRLTIISPRRVRRSKWPTRKTPTIPACGNSSTRNPTSRRSNRSASQRMMDDRKRGRRNDAVHPFAREIKSMTRKGLAVAVALAAAVFADTAYAQFYKGKTVTMIINYPAGGPTDIEGRIVAQHLPAHIAGKPTIVIKNVGGAGGVIGTNQLAEAAPNGETMGFFTIDVVAQLLGNPALRVNYADFEILAGVEEPLVAYARKDTPPGLKEVETAILQNEGQVANTSLPGWTGSVEPTMGHLVIPLWQLAPRGKDGSYPRSLALPDLPTFEEFYAAVKGGKRPSGFTYEVLRASSDPMVGMFRTALMPPKTPTDAVALMRSAFVELWKNPEFIRDYANVIKTKPIFVTGEEAQDIVAALAKVKPEIKAFLLDYSNRLVR